MIFGIFAAGLLAMSYVGTPSPGEKVLGHAKAWAIAAGMMATITIIYVLARKRYRREENLLRTGRVAPALVTKVERLQNDSIPFVHWTWLAPSGERVKRSTGRDDFSRIPQEGEIISVLYEPDNPAYCKPYGTLAATLKNARVSRQ